MLIVGRFHVAGQFLRGCWLMVFEPAVRAIPRRRPEGCVQSLLHRIQVTDPHRHCATKRAGKTRAVKLAHSHLRFALLRFAGLDQARHRLVCQNVLGDELGDPHIVLTNLFLSHIWASLPRNSSPFHWRCEVCATPGSIGRLDRGGRTRRHGRPRMHQGSGCLPGFCQRVAISTRFPLSDFARWAYAMVREAVNPVPTVE